MKLKLFILALGLTICQTIFAQSKIKLTVLNVDTQGMVFTPEQMGNLLRIEAEKLDTFEVMDRYDVAYLIKKNNLALEDCYGKICLVETGKVLNADKVLSGTIELYGETIFLTLRLIDVKKQIIERSHVQEYLNLPKETQLMMRVSLRKLFGMPVEKVLEEGLTKKFNYESAINNPDATSLNLNGPRMGGVFYSGEVANILKEKEANGGFDVYPVMFQFGYQYEIQYLNQGAFQALFEILPLITGLDQNMFIPSLTFMNGMRNSRWGLELGFGPTFNVVKQARGYFQEGQWLLENTWDMANGANPYEIVYRLDSRGDYRLNTGFVFGIGKTFRSGKLNIPVNVFVIPAVGNSRFGISLGYNTQKRY